MEGGWTLGLAGLGFFKYWPPVLPVKGWLRSLLAPLSPGLSCIHWWQLKETKGSAQELSMALKSSYEQSKTQAQKFNSVSHLSVEGMKQHWEKSLKGNKSSKEENSVGAASIACFLNFCIHQVRGFCTCQTSKGKFSLCWCWTCTAMSSAQLLVPTKKGKAAHSTKCSTCFVLRIRSASSDWTFKAKTGSQLITVVVRSRPEL